MNQDEELRAALKQAAAGLPVGPAPVTTVVGLGRRMRRRRVALPTVLAAAVLVPALAVTVTSLGSSGSATPTIPAASASATSQARVVASGEKIALGRSHTMRLTGTGVFLSSSPPSGTADEPTLKAAAVPEGAVAAISYGDTSSSLCVGIYRGPETGVTITAALGGRTLNTQTATLPGTPGWTAFFTDEGREGARSGSALTVTVRAADGTILASQTKLTGN
ncbi:hypothetical protein ACN6LM_001557 [Streptomyces sp. SAS_281]|uniref:hypothetical protein n=1 Tax=Streptomyces sp. SAS_281 TaxID=3412744 RepID=UPI00403C745A